MNLTSIPARRKISVLSFLFTLLLLAGVQHVLWSQKAPPSISSVESDLAHAEALLRSFKNDSAGMLARRSLAALKEQGMLDTPLGIRMQLLEATALERDEQNELALQKLLHVEELSLKKKQWDALAKSCLTLALLHEKLGRGEQSLEDLRQTKSVIAAHALDSIYPYYAIRTSSWHRIFGDRDSALYFAQEALRTAPQFNLNLEEAIGHMLMGILLRESAPKKSLRHCLSALRIYQALEDYTGCSYVYAGIANHFFDQKDYPLAMAYNDSMIATAHKAISLGHEKHGSIAKAYRFRGAVFKELGRSDSAWHYMRKGYEMELNDLRGSTAAKVIEIDARYNDELKTRQLEEQTLALRLRNSQLRYSTMTAVLILLLAGGLSLGLYKQRQSKRKLSEQNKLILQQSEKLKTLDAAKSRFFANVSHELRTPLTLILGPVKTLLQENQLSEKQTRLLQMARQNGRQLEQLINEILDLRKLEAGKMELHREPVVLADFFNRHFTQFESLAERREIEFSFQTDFSPSTIGLIDAEKCRQIIYNLLSNAFKFTPPGGRITATVNQSNDTLLIQVADTGPGIHPDDLPHVFDQYFQTIRPDKPAEGGTGIGLALCQEYARLFGGDISVESAPGQGAVFTVAFPLALSEEPIDPLSSTPKSWQAVSMPSPRPAWSLPTANRPTILVVEDNADLREYIRLILSDKYHVLTAGNGEGALNYLYPGANRLPHSLQLPTAPPQLILSDLMMPVMDGYQLLEKLKSDDATRHIPVIMLTARAEAGDKLKALRIGVDDYLTKPFDEEELLARIENLLKNSAIRQTEVAAEPKEETPLSIMSQADHEWLETFEAYVQNHFSSDILSVSTLARKFAMSESTLLRLLKRLTGLSPVQYLQEVRLNEARRLLENRRYDSIAKVASMVGYDDARSFARSFRQRFGKLPSEV